MNFVRLIENNDHEGETWRFYLQHDGNEQALEDLRLLLEKYEDDLSEEFEFGLLLSENDVDVLVKYTDQGYMDNENKITGHLELPEVEDSEQLREMLYKGGIAKYFK